MRQDAFDFVTVDIVAVAQPERRRTGGARTGQDLGGIRTVDDVKRRCRVLESECWHWTGARCSHNKAQAWFPALQKTTTVRVGLYWILYNKAPPEGRRYVPLCGDDGCVNPEHHSLKSISELTTAGSRRNPIIHATKIAAGRQRLDILTDEGAAEIRLSEEPARDLAQRFGVALSTVYRIRNGERRPETPCNSVFALGKILAT